MNSKILESLKADLEVANKNRDYKAAVDTLNLISDKSRKGLILNGLLDITSRAIQLADDIRYPEGKAISLVNHAISQSLLGINDKVDDHLNSAYKIAEPLDDKTAFCYVLIGSNSLNQKRGEFLEAFKSLSRALEISIELKNKTLTRNALFFLARLSFLIGDFDLSIDYGLKGVEIIPDPSEMKIIAPIDSSRFYDGIGYCCWKADRPDEALEFLNKAVSEAGNSNSYLSLINARVNLGLVYRSLSFEDRALENMKIAAELAANTGVEFNQIMFLEDFAQFYTEGADFKQALMYREKLENICKKNSDHHTLVDNYIEIVAIYTKLRRFNEADAMLNSIVAELNELHSDKLRYKYNLSASELYEATEDYEKALEFHKKYHMFYDFYSKDEAKRNLRKIFAKAEIDSLTRHQ